MQYFPPSLRSLPLTVRRLVPHPAPPSRHLLRPPLRHVLPAAVGFPPPAQPARESHRHLSSFYSNFVSDQL